MPRELFVLTTGLIAVVLAAIGLTGAFGTNNASAGGNRDIEVEPKRIEPGKNLTVRGHGFVGRKRLRLKAGRAGGRVETIEII